MSAQKLSLPSLLQTITHPYTPQLLARLDNAYDVKVARTQGEFIWHSHPENDELFCILNGELTIQVERDGGEIADVVLGKGDLFVVPRGVRHRPVGEAEIMLVERVGTVNTGDVEGSTLTRKVEDVRLKGEV